MVSQVVPAARPTMKECFDRIKKNYVDGETSSRVMRSESQPFAVRLPERAAVSSPFTQPGAAPAASFRSASHGAQPSWLLPGPSPGGSAVAGFGSPVQASRSSRGLPPLRAQYGPTAAFDDLVTLSMQGNPGSSAELSPRGEGDTVMNPMLGGPPMAARQQQQAREAAYRADQGFGSPMATSGSGSPGSPGSPGSQARGSRGGGAHAATLASSAPRSRVPSLPPLPPSPLPSCHQRCCPHHQRRSWSRLSTRLPCLVADSLRF